MEMNQYLDIFIEESKEHLQSLNTNLLDLEKENSNMAIINEIFRTAHTLKGMSATMGYSKMANLTHEMENLLQEIRNNNIAINSDIMDVLFECLDSLEEYVGEIASTGDEGELSSSELVNKLNEIINNDYKDSKEEVATATVSKKNTDDISIDLDEYTLRALQKANDKGLKSFVLKVRLNKGCMLKAARAFIIFKTLETHSEILKAEPSVEDIEDEKFEDSFTLTIVSKYDEEKIKKEILLISEVEEVNIHTINIESDLEDINSNIKKEKLEQQGNTENSIKENEDKNKKNKVQIQEQLKKNVSKNKKTTNIVGKTVRVDIDRLDNLMNLVSELIIIKTRMEDIGDSNNNQNMNEAIEYLERITTNLHDAVMKVRMVPIERVFNRFPRMVRDLSKDLNKTIKLIMSGEETEVDRTVIDEIGDPLIHLIRNAIDHGIEKPNIRTKNGKPDFGTINLRSYPDGNNVVIEVQDDGDGIDNEKVKQKAISRGILNETTAATLSDDEICEYIFKPGFSTSETVTDVSGRGVGLDVVKSKIESIGGIVEIDSTRGEGSKFTIRIPLSLAIIQALMIKLKDEIYAIPLSSIKEISPISSSNIQKIHDQEVILFRGKTLPLIRLRNILGLEEKNDSEELITVIVKKGDKEAGLIVDDLIGQQEIVIKSLGKYLSGIKYMTGATILGNGNISLILDINSIF
ncbi:chemotaxis protein CheA [Abyssisolibacter fermentans]|uniref:chemotaxis protein CheA n=1 Tax=Abyssisolibacter fermentans TaxID=1766203 RepID=UPI00083650CB|nr:chemotaxis protein CheA [Abyssisolibacter fermentans]